ncbi:uncharacterized protein NDAI_0A05660 [Naumovozyma dairenensis CBS 421]|uniref:Uncharacterized protein n=1 Tax=Naumovozyma dairenensis (strain ATCC 10597 / BCRC 20456 / CBS 421 / NBRC 0211 / NRRL Y-12639) TaxID=1071378 RepID=G0W4I3_NAUDC|nr:hypothetical protein NDAI_0A05660 [Naumovozyma dairenensis CBS 421]CCD22721.1 hypothetical protein NDAI_0A05660 [Naumovozyma dairenensis CBS 421]
MLRFLLLCSIKAIISVMFKLPLFIFSLLSQIVTNGIYKLTISGRDILYSQFSSDPSLKTHKDPDSKLQALHCNFYRYFHIASLMVFLFLSYMPIIHMETSPKDELLNALQEDVKNQQKSSILKHHHLIGNNFIDDTHTEVIEYKFSPHLKAIKLSNSKRRYGPVVNQQHYPMIKTGATGLLLWQKLGEDNQI